jgi:hypothetical protein
MERVYHLYHHQPVYGDTQAWAISSDTKNGNLIIRYGQSGSLHHSEFVSTDNPRNDRLLAILAQESEGYRYIGDYRIHPGGCPYLQAGIASDAILQGSMEDYQESLIWRLDCRFRAPEQAGLLRRMFYKLSERLKQAGYAQVREHWVCIDDWSIGLTSQCIAGVNSICCSNVTGFGAITSKDGILPALFLMAIIKPLGDSAFLSFKSPAACPMELSLNKLRSTLGDGGLSIKELCAVMLILDLQDPGTELAMSTLDLPGFYF